MKRRTEHASDTTKPCVACGEILPLSEFSAETQNWDGLRRDCKKCQSNRKTSYYAKNSETIKAKAKKWRLENPDKNRAATKRWREQNPEKQRIINRRSQAKRADRDAEHRRSKRRALVIEVLLAYGGKCKCCGESNLNFLTLDHVNRDGAAHKKELPGNGAGLYRWAKRNGYPARLQVLCFNCNCGSWRCGGICPHKLGTKTMTDARGQHGNASTTDYNRPVWPREYAPAPSIPGFFSSGLFHKFGANPHGEANYRVRWGMDERQFSNGNPNAIKYPGPHDPELGWACFMVERWAPPDFFNEDEWNRVRFGELTTAGYVDHLGPYRTRGSFILVAPLATERDGQPYEMLPLTEKVLQELYQRLGFGALKPDEKLAQMELNRRLRKSNAQKVLRKALDDNFEFYRQKTDLINTLASRHTVAPSIDKPVKTTIDETRKLFVSKGASDEHTARTSV